ncbi:uridylate-specific endoribonuclease B-like [Montipora foliosa]|uniref:uridylate-specific endoribonuclease B-like n=1 Tax=Montipora foliosa TaxID=591990 RepID=UPI0035F1143D
MHNCFIFFVFLISVVPLFLVKTSRGASSRKVDLGNVCQSMWDSDDDNLKIGKEIVIYTGSRQHPLITVTRLGRRKLQRGVFVKFTALLDNYEADNNVPEKTSSEELQEENAFINSIAVKGGPMEIAFKYLQKKGSILSESLSQFKPILKKMWFDKFAKRGGGNNYSGFEHVFVGELENERRTNFKITKGFHNWIQFLSETKAGRLIHHPPPIRKFVNSQMAIVWTKLQWRGARKPPGSSFFIGTSPSFEMALYTACFFQSSQCTCKINGKSLTITAVNYQRKGYVLTAYPKI